MTDDLRRLRAAADTEPLYWTELDDGEKVLTDRYGRQLEQVRKEAARALDLAERTVSIADEVEVGLTQGRTYGPTLERRLRTSTHTILNVYERDNMIAEALERAWEVEAEKRAQRQAEKGEKA